MNSMSEDLCSSNVMVSINGNVCDENIECILDLHEKSSCDTSVPGPLTKPDSKSPTSAADDEVDSLGKMLSKLSLVESNDKKQTMMREDSSFSIVPYFDTGMDPCTPVRNASTGQMKMTRYSPCSVLEDIQSGEITKESMKSMPCPFRPSTSLPKLMAMTPSCSSTTLSTDCDESFYPISEDDDTISMGSSEIEEDSYDEQCLYSTPTRSFEVRETIKMPLVSEQQLKMISVRKTNLEAKLLVKKRQQQRRERMKMAGCVACFLVDFVYDGRFSLVGTAATIALLTC